MVGAISNGVDGNRESHFRGFTAKLEQLFTIHVEDAAIVSFANIRLEHCCRMWTQCAVHKHFDRADAKPVIAETRAETKLVRLVKQFHRDIFEHAQLELPLFMKLLERHKGIAPVKIVDASQAHFP